MTREETARALPEHRRDAVLAWLKTSTGACANCGAPVTVSQPRTTGKAGREHLHCPAS